MMQTAMHQPMHAARRASSRRIWPFTIGCVPVSSCVAPGR
jgi:hypothetical protein